MTAADSRDIVIVGAGPIGLATALRLKQQGRSPRLLDARAAGAAQHDSRILALSHGSRQLLEALGAWPQAVATPIETIHISQRGTLGSTTLAHAEYGLPALGYVLRASALIASLMQALERAGMQIEHDAKVGNITANADEVLLEVTGAHGDVRLVKGRVAVCCEGRVAAEDADAALMTRDYDQHALLLKVKPLHAHRNIARERFTPQGPIALLPLGADYAVVWTVTPEQLAQLQSLPDAALLERLHEAFGGRLRFAEPSERSHYPLTLRVRKNTVAPRTVWLGNAAQTLHPVAGQGLNLGLRDVWDFAEALHGTSDPGSEAALQTYARRRRADRWGTAGFTDGLVRLFSNDNPLLNHARGAGLFALGMLPPVRHFIAKRMIFGARAWP